MAFVYYTIAGLVLYFVSDRILEMVEFRLGRRLEYRSLVFFGIILVLALVTFRAIEWMLVNQPG